MTPLQFDERLKRLKTQQRREDYRFGVVASIIANAHRDRKKNPRGFKPETFFPSLKEPEET